MDGVKLPQAIMFEGLLLKWKYVSHYIRTIKKKKKILDDAQWQLRRTAGLVLVFGTF